MTASILLFCYYMYELTTHYGSNFELISIVIYACLQITSNGLFPSLVYMAFSVLRSELVQYGTYDYYVLVL